MMAVDSPATNLWQYLLNNGGDLKPRSHKQKHTPSKNMKAPDDDTLRQHPWLESFLARGGAIKARRRLHMPAQRLRVGNLAQSEPMLEVVRALAAKQQEFNELLLEKPSYFAVSVRGGKWTQINLNTPFDCVISRPTSSDAAGFCEVVGVQKLHSFAFSKFSCIKFF